MAGAKSAPETLELEPRGRAIVEFAVKVTRAPSSATRADVDGLRAHGLSDEDVLILTHVIGYFNHINRIADALGIDLEGGMAPSPYEDGEPPGS